MFNKDFRHPALESLQYLLESNKISKIQFNHFSILFQKPEKAFLLSCSMENALKNRLKELDRELLQQPNSTNKNEFEKEQELPILKKKIISLHTAMENKRQLIHDIQENSIVKEK
jgi:hypothetical protein